MHDIRSSFVAGEGVRKSLVAAKKKRSEGEASGSLVAVPIPRAESRTSDHRREERDYDFANEAVLIHRRRKHPAVLVNISSSGAMLEADLEFRIGSPVELQIADTSPIRGIVRWIKGRRFGIEFDEQTDIVTTGRTRAAIVAAHNTAATAARAMVPRSTRHGLVWSGTLYWTFESYSVRIRNISAGGAQLECERDLPPEAPIRLHLLNAGTFAGTVSWSTGGQTGIKFDEPFDMRLLANTQPSETAERVAAVAVVQPQVGTRPESRWAARWASVQSDRTRR